MLAPMPRYRAVFRCFAGCSGEYPLTQPLYRCPTCDGLLAVVHDMEALRDRSAAGWMKLFEDRWMRTEWPYGSGVWGKREWVPRDAGREHRLDGRRWNEHLLGGEVRSGNGSPRPLGQAVRQLATGASRTWA